MIGRGVAGLDWREETPPDNLFQMARPSDGNGCVSGRQLHANGWCNGRKGA